METPTYSKEENLFKNTNIEKAKKDFFITTPLVAVFLLLLLLWNGDSWTLALLKTAFTPIFMIAVIGVGILWPKASGDTYSYIIWRHAIGSLPVAFFYLVGMVSPKLSVDALGSSFAFFYLMFFLLGSLIEIFTSGPGGKREYSRN